MPLKILNALLLIAAIFGGVCTFQKSRQHRDLLTEINGLESKVGELAIVDPSKVHVRAIDTGEDLHFAWRIYLPAGFRATWQHRNGGNSMTTRSDPCEFIARLRVYEGDQDGLASHRNGRLHVYYKGSGGSSRATLGDRKLADMLRGRLSEIKVEQLGS
ncbi:MAG: hypothetical protein U9N87_12210, partial [Planctomycetota bacterium]|nr:hypothetical protein [Planctomycetota bacterium]